MAKTELTLQLEKEIHQHVKRLGLVFCTEVSIGKGGKERVDGMSIDSKDIVRCYEVKVSKQDFYSKAKKSFVGHYNYYVMPKELYDIVEKDIPKHIGVYCGAIYGFIKNPTKQKLSVKLDTLKTSMMFALYREAVKGWNNKDNDRIAKLNAEINSWKKKYNDEVSDYRELNNKMKYVKYWLRENGMITIDEIIDDMDGVRR